MTADTDDRQSIHSVRCAVLAGESSWHFKDLVRAAEKIKRAGRASIELRACRFEQLAGGLKSNQSSFSFQPGVQWDADAVFVRVMPAGTLEQIVFRMDLLQRLMLGGTVVINSPKTIEASVDKYLCLAKLAAEGLPVPDTRVSQTFQQAVLDFELLGGNVVVKPIFGSMGRGIERLTNLGQAKDCFDRLIQQGAVVYQQEFVPSDGSDLRLLVIGQQVWAMRRKATNGWITNISQGGQGFAHDLTEPEIELALRSARAVGASIAGVDLIYDKTNGQAKVLEVNASVGWKAISQVLQVDFAEQVLLSILRAVELQRNM